MVDESPERVYEQFHDRVNMTSGELAAWADSDNYQAYKERKSGGQPISEPRSDVRRLLDTPKDQWRDVDDGFNEVAQANEVLAFTGRMKANEQGDPMPGTDPELSKRDASLLNWGFDPNPDRRDFVGDQ